MERRKRSWLTRRDKVELFEQIRREYEFGVGMIAVVSRKLGVHRRMVRDALRRAEPAARKPQQRRLRTLEKASAFIDQILTEDRQVPVKQRHTARRIWQRLCAELPSFAGSERTVRGYVHRQRRQLRFVAKVVALRNEDLVLQKPHRLLALAHILAHRGLADDNLRHPFPQPHPNVMHRMPLLARRLAVRFENRIDERNCGSQLGPLPLWSRALAKAWRKHTSSFHYTDERAQPQ